MRNFGVFIVVFVSVVLGGCGDGASGVALGTVSSDYGAPEVAGKIESEEIKESSGLAVSKCQPNVLWTHNDAGSDAFIYGLSPEGKHLGTWKVQNTANMDWEDIAAFKDASGKCFLLIGDIGDNKDERTELSIYRIPEPVVSPDDSGSNTRNPLQTEPAEVLKFGYPDSSHNAETLLVHPQTGDLYVLTKSKSGPSKIYKITPAFGAATAAKAEKVGELSVPSDPAGLLTGGSISPDGKRVILCDVRSGYELVLPDGAAGFDAIWQQKPLVVNLGDRKQGEGVSYSADGKSIYAGSEKKNATIFVVKRK